MNRISLNKKIIKVNQALLDYFGKPIRHGKRTEPIDMLIATILSQNTNDKNSYRAYKNLRQKFPNWFEVSNASQSQIENEIKIAGLAKQKAKAIKNVLIEIREKHNVISLDFLHGKNNSEIIEALTKFKGVGVKTASCVLLFSMDRNICPVDTHVHRTTNRIGLVKTTSADKTFRKINENFPKKIAHSFHTNLIRLGREICLSQNPKCTICPVNKLCKYPQKNKSQPTQLKQNKFMLLDNV